MLLKLVSIVDVFICNIFYYYFSALGPVWNVFIFCINCDFSSSRRTTRTTPFTFFLSRTIFTYLFCPLSLSIAPSPPLYPIHCMRGKYAVDRHCQLHERREHNESQQQPQSQQQQHNNRAEALLRKCAKCLMAIACSYHINKAVI